MLIRHALPVRIDDAPGGADPELSEVGHQQADQLAQWWATEVDAVWCSPMLRARQTASPLASASGLDVGIDDDLAEMDRDSNSYVPLEQLRQDPTAWAEAVDSWVGEAGDQIRHDFRRRVVAAVDRIVAAHRSQRVAVVCHGGVINAYLAEALGLQQSLFFEPGYVSVSRVQANSAGARQILSVNETWHVSNKDRLVQFRRARQA